MIFHRWSVWIQSVFRMHDFIFANPIVDAIDILGIMYECRENDFGLIGRRCHCQFACRQHSSLHNKNTQLWTFEIVSYVPYLFMIPYRYYHSTYKYVYGRISSKFVFHAFKSMGLGFFVFFVVSLLFCLFICIPCLRSPFYLHCCWNMSHVLVYSGRLLYDIGIAECLENSTNMSVCVCVSFVESIFMPSA